MIDTWIVDEPYPQTLAEIRSQLINESGLRESIVDRGLKRLENVVANGNNIWVLAGRHEFGDNFPTYTVSLKNTTYHCSCFIHSWGESREHHLCSHIIAVIAARRLTRAEPQVATSRDRTELTPASLGLPLSFSRFRDTQLLALERIRKSKKRFVLLQAPTGSGKSLVVAAAQRLLQTRVLYTCHTKQLQDQFLRDFACDLHGSEYAVELKGRANYPTLRYPHLFPQINASMCTSKKETHCRWCCDGDCGGEQCHTKSRCPYRVQKAHAVGAVLAVVNTALFLSEANYVGQFSEWPWLVLDEADLIESALFAFVGVEITQRWISRLGLEPPKRKTVHESWIEWADSMALPVIRKELQKLESEYGVEDMRRQQELERIQSKLKFFLEEVSAKWVFLPSDERWTFKPVFISKYAERYLWRHASRFLLMSATIISPDELSHSLGIPRNEMDFIDLPSTFSPQQRPIYYLPVANLTKKTEDVELPKAIATLDQILGEHSHEKVLIHTVSYGYAQQIVSMSRHQKRMLIYNQAKDREVKLEEFKKAQSGTVLVASSMDRGVDLPGDLCRVVVVMKMPFPNLGDRQISARLHSDRRTGQLWYTVSTIRTLVQMCGRGMRSTDDWCSIYILDSQFERLYKENRFLFPEWWRAALHTAERRNT